MKLPGEDLFQQSGVHRKKVSSVRDGATWRVEYEKYLKSALWRNLRRDIIKLRGSKCEMCNRAFSTLQVHHLSYERLGNEKLSDLQVVCAACHRKADEEREKKTAMAREDRAYRNAFDTWCRKKFGVGAEHATEDDCRDFDEWLDRKLDDDDRFFREEGAW